MSSAIIKFPPYNSPCSSVEGIFWFETKDGDCKATWDSMNTDALDRESLFGVDYIYGATKGEKRQAALAGINAALAGRVALRD